MDTSRSVIKTDLRKLSQTQRDAIERSDGLEKALQASKSRILTLEASNAGARQVAAASDSKAALVEEELAAVQAQLQETQWAFNKLPMTNRDFSNNTYLFAQLIDELDTS